MSFSHIREGHFLPQKTIISEAALLGVIWTSRSGKTVSLPQNNISRPGERMRHQVCRVINWIGRYFSAYRWVTSCGKRLRQVGKNRGGQRTNLWRLCEQELSTNIKYPLYPPLAKKKTEDPNDPHLPSTKVTLWSSGRMPAQITGPYKVWLNQVVYQYLTLERKARAR